MPSAVITGATKGIGRAVAEKLLSEGYDIAICARTTNDLRNLHDHWELNFPENKIFMQNVDVQQKDQVRDFARNIRNNFKEIDVLVNNAGIFIPGNLMDEPERQLETMMEVNLYSAYYLTRALLPMLLEKGSGHIFNISSVAALKAYPGGGSYSISKFALLGFTENLRYELRHKGIKVTAVLPGAVWTDSWSGSGVSRDRLMEAEDISESIWNAINLSPKAMVEQIVLRPQQGDL